MTQGTKYRCRPGDPDERRRLIELRVREAEKKHQIRREYKFRNGVDLPVIDVPIDQLVYRLENYRTRDKQLSLEATGKVDRHFFDSGRREDPAVQQEQHALLYELASRGSGETIKPILEEMDRAGEQTDELTISAEGVVVNGNRRLCAMRELLREDGPRFAKFANVRCAVLPPTATKQEIRALEIGLQMQPETKLPYEWTALGRAVHDLRTEGFEDDAIALTMNRTPKEVKRLARMVEGAHDYLEMWLGRTDEFDQLEDTEQAFTQIAAKNLSGENTPQREVTRQFEYLLIENRSSLTDRAYALINAIEAQPSEFLRQAALELRVDLNAPSSAQRRRKISFESGAVNPGPDYAPLVERLRDIQKDTKAAQATTRALERIALNLAEQGRNRDKAALKFAQRAESSLRAIDMDTASLGTYDEISGVLTRCEQLCASLKANIVERKKRSSSR